MYFLFYMNIWGDIRRRLLAAVPNVNILLKTEIFYILPTEIQIHVYETSSKYESVCNFLKSGLKIIEHRLFKRELLLGICRQDNAIVSIKRRHT